MCAMAKIIFSGFTNRNHLWSEFILIQLWLQNHIYLLKVVYPNTDPEGILFLDFKLMHCTAYCTGHETLKHFK